jgi:hypothetical protein
MEPEGASALSFSLGHDWARIAIHAASDDGYEREAERVSERVMRMPAASLAHACECGGVCSACGGHAPGAGDAVRGVQRRAPRPFAIETVGAGVGRGEVPSLVAEALSTPGQPLDRATREFMEPRFGRDLGPVRIHTDRLAAESAAAVMARAYTVGVDVVFGAGQYAPASPEGRGLLAHELTHVLQQGGASGGSAGGRLQRACLSASQCGVREGSAVQAGIDVAKAEAPAREARQARPIVIHSRSHGGPAVEAERLFKARLPRLAPMIHGVFVDEDQDRNVGASVEGCLSWAQRALPKDADLSRFQGATLPCVFVSKTLEQEAEQFRIGRDRVGDRPRDAWLLDIVGRFTHEATHQRFRERALQNLHPEVAFPTPAPEDLDCHLDFQDGEPIGLAREVGELAAEISEYPVHRDASERELQAWFNKVLTATGESIPGTIRGIRCNCACDSADGFIRAAFELGSATWSDEEKATFHAEMKRGRGKEHGVYWPFDVPPRTGGVGRHELGLGLGSTLGGSRRLPLEMLTYRYVLSQWASGRLRLTVGAHGNVGALLPTLPGFSKGGEYGAATLGLHWVSTPRAVERRFGGFTARIDTGLGVGEFSLRPVGGGEPETDVRGDFILEVGPGVQFYLQGLTRLFPVTVEATYRYTRPFGPRAEALHAGILRFTYEF